MTDPLTRLADNPLEFAVTKERHAGYKNSEVYKGLEEQGIDPIYAWYQDKVPAGEHDDIDAFDAWAPPPGRNPNAQTQEKGTIPESDLVNPETSYGKDMRQAGAIMVNYLRNKTPQRPVGFVGNSPTPGQVANIVDSVSTTSGIPTSALSSLDKMSDKDHGQFMLEFLGQNEHNMSFGAGVWLDTDNMPPEVLAALAGSIELYDQLPTFSWSGSGRLVKGVLGDLSTYVGLSSLAFVKNLLAGGSKQIGKGFLRDRILKKLYGSAFVGVEGSGYAAMMDLFKQKAEAGNKPFVYNKERGALAAGMGFAAGGALTAAMVNPDLIAKGVKLVGKKAINIADSFIGNGTALRMFAGPMSETADKAMLSQAKKMEGAGSDRNAIWEETGWFRDKDKKWKYEISDRDAEFDFQELKGTQNVELNKALNHKELFKAYPWLENTPIGKKFMGSTLGTFNRDNKNISVSPVSDDPLSTVLHEIQHAIQEHEGFAKGASPTKFYLSDSARELTEDELDIMKAWRSWAELKNGNPSASYEKWEMDYKESGGSVPFDLSKLPTHQEQIDDLIEGERVYSGVLERADYPDIAYHLTPGEVEARNVQARKNMKPLSRAEVPPWETIDVNESDILPTKTDSWATINTPLSTGPRVEHAIPTEADNPNSIINMVYNTDDSVPMAPINAPRKRWTKAVLGKVMDQQARQAGRVVKEYNDKSLETISNTIANEAIAALNREGNASNWYNSKIKEMNEVLQEIHPELVPGSTDEGAFKIALAITSNGSTVDSNMRAAEHIYRVFKKTGKFPTDLKSLTKDVGGFGKESQTLVLQMQRANNIIDEMGPDKFIEFLNTKFTTKDLNKMGYKLSGEGANYETFGSAIFGPKIGGGFYQNLRGNFDPVTFDRWWMASWGRWTGNSLIKTPKETQAKRIAKFRELSGSKSKTDKALINQANKIFNVYKKNNFQPRTELNKAAQRVAEGAQDVMREQPNNSSERNFMRATVAKALEKMRAMGYDITPADLQATVWYPEKELHGKYKIGSGRSAPMDYATAAYKLLEEINAE